MRLVIRAALYGLMFGLLLADGYTFVEAVTAIMIFPLGVER